MNDRVSLEVREFNRLKERLAADFALDADDDAIIDTAEGETDLTGLLIRMVRTVRQRAAEAEVCAKQIAALTERKRRHTDAADKLRALVAEAMIETGLKRLSPGDFTASVTMTKAKPEIVNEEDLPGFYTQAVVRPDKTAINDEFARCQAENAPFYIPGVTISNGRPSLTVRT